MDDKITLLLLLLGLHLRIEKLNNLIFREVGVVTGLVSIIFLSQPECDIALWACPNTRLVLDPKVD